MIRSGTVALAAILTISAAAAEPITELEPFLKDGARVEGTPAGDGSYTGVTLGRNGETTVDRFSFSIDGDRLTDLRMEGIAGSPDEDGTVAGADLIEIRNSAVPMNMDDAEPAEVFDFFLDLDAERIAMEGFKMTEKDGATMTLGNVSAENVVDGLFGSVSLSDLVIDDTTEDGLPFQVRIGGATLKGIGVAWAIYMRNMAVENDMETDEDFDALSDEAAFLDRYRLSDHLVQLRLEGFSVNDVAVSVNGLDVFALDGYDYQTTQFSGDFPAGGLSTFSGSVNMQNVSSLPNPNPNAAMGIQAFLAAYGKPVVPFSGRIEQVWSEAERTVRLSAIAVDIEGILRQSIEATFSNYDPASMLRAAESPDDGITVVTAMEGVTVSDASVRLTDQGALDLGFTLAPPNIDRGQIAMQAAQFAGIGVIQAMQLGIEISGSVAEVISGFIRDGGSIEVRLADGTELPLDKLYALSARPQDAALAQELLGMLKLEILGSR